MTKKRVFLFVTLIMMMAFTVSAYAINYSGEGKKRGQTYNISKKGGNSSFNAVGTTSQCYTGLVNNSTNSIYMVASVQSYEHGVNEYTKKQNAKVTAAGIQILSGYLTRYYTNDIYDYYHGAETYSTTFQSSSMRVDTYSYKAKQYY